MENKTEVPRILFITNIPAPYRVELFNDLATQEIDLHVWYFLKEIGTRPWRFDEKIMKHHHWVANSWHRRLNDYSLFISPNLIFKLIKEDHPHIVLALGWNDFDVLIICVLKRLGLIRAKIGFWSEANSLTVGAKKTNFVKYFYRRFIYNTSDGAQLISGNMTAATLKEWGAQVKHPVVFPNTISELVHDPRRIKINRRNRKPTILITARIIERYKGIMNFLASLSDDQIKSVKILIAGDGPDRFKLIDYISFRKIDDQVVLLGNLEAENLAETYAQVDAFCLPSFSDQNPLSVIEAMRWRLPILLSNHCGNADEAVKDGVNGFLFDPFDKAQISKKFDQFLAAHDRWVEMGLESERNFNKYYSKQKVIEGFCKALQDMN